MKLNSLVIDPLKDHPIIISDLSPNTENLITAKTVDKLNRVWKSESLHLSNKKGEILLDDSSSLRGSYKGVSKFGIFWSMKCEELGRFEVLPDDLNLSVDLSIGDKSEKLTLLTFENNLLQEEVYWEGNQGRIIHPSGEVKGGVIVLSGSNGGINLGLCRFLATHGYLALALPYFNYEDLPNHLESIPLEYFEVAMENFSKHRKLKDKKVGLCGGSRGGELVLLLGSLYPQMMDFIVARCPASVVYGGFNPNREDDFSGWTKEGKELDYFYAKEKSVHLEEIYPISYVQSFLNDREMNRDFYEENKIQVEKINCPTLIAYGDDDCLWPASTYAKEIEERARKFNKEDQFKFLGKEGLGHLFPFPAMPSTSMDTVPEESGFSMSLGGSPEMIFKGSLDFYKTFLAFLKENI